MMDSDHLMEEDRENDTFSACRKELEIICSRLAENGEESVILTVNMAEKSCQYITSQMGEKFLSGRIELLEQFFKLCYDEYASTSIQDNTQLSKKEKEAVQNRVCKDNLVISKCYSCDIQVVGDKNEEFLYNLRNKGLPDKDRFEKVLVEKDESFPVDDSYALTQNDLLINMDGSDNSMIDGDHCADDQEENNGLTLKPSNEKTLDKDCSPDSQNRIDPVSVTSGQIESPTRFNTFIANSESIAESQTNKLDDSKGNRKRKQSETDCDSLTESCTVKKRSVSAVLHGEKMEKNVTKIMYGCPVCGKTFNQCSYLSIHMASVHLDKCNICKKCGAIFDSATDLKRHKFEQHSMYDSNEKDGEKSKEITYKCPTCGKIFRRVDKFSVHMASVHFNKRSICKDCGKMFESTELLRLHKREHTIPNDENKTKSVGVKEHKKKIKFTCPTCGNFFARATGLAYHMAAVHLKKYSVCGECGKLFDSIEHLRKHKIEHISVDEDKFDSKEGEMVKYACPTCGKCFLQFSYLSIHMKNVHMDKRSLCNICCKLFDSKEELIEHKAQHTKLDTENVSDTENPIEENNRKGINLTCPTCGETFSECKYLSVHMKSVHFDKRSVCKDCGKIFYTKAGLIKHQKEHEQSNDDNVKSEFEKGEKYGKINLRLRGRNIRKTFETSKRKSEHADKKQFNKTKTFSGKHMSKLSNVKQNNVNSTISSKNLKINFTCPICEKTFLKCGYITTHMKKVHSQACHVCRYCGRFCDSEDDLKQHTVEHVNSELENAAQSETEEGKKKISEVKFTCQICGKMFSRGGYLTDHMRGVHKTKGITCKHCGIFFVSNDDYSNHKIECYSLLRNNYTDKSEVVGGNKISILKFMCPKCGRMFAQGRYLTGHLATSHKERASICIKCGRIFNSYDNLLKHKIKHTQLNYDNNTKDHYDVEEGELYIRERSGDIFSYRRIEELTEDISCDKITRQYRHDIKKERIGGKKKDDINADKNVEDIMGENCTDLDGAIDYGASSQNMIKDLAQESGSKKDEIVRNAEMTNSSSGYFTCEYCGRVFNLCRYLLAHLKYVHADGRSICKYCAKTFTTPLELREHYRSIHKKYTRFNGVCEYCGKSFKRSSQLDIHRRFHLGEKPYKCKICGVGFLYSKTLNSHIDTHHGSQKYQCAECGRLFKSSYILGNHVKLHKKEIIKCNYCDSQFKMQASYHLHLLREHASLLDWSKIDFEYYRCQYCPKLYTKKQEFERHVGTHTGESKVTCPECGKVLSSSKTFERHRYSHNPVKKYTCEICNSSTNFESKLRQHFKSEKHRSNCEKLGITLEESKKKVSVYRSAEENAQQQELITPNNDKQEQITPSNDDQEQITPNNDDEEQITPNNDMSKNIFKRDFSKEIPLAVSSIEDGTIIISLPDNITLPLGEGEVTYDFGDGTVIQSVL